MNKPEIRKLAEIMASRFLCYSTPKAKRKLELEARALKQSPFETASRRFMCMLSEYRLYR